MEKKSFSDFVDICERVSKADAQLARTGQISRHADAIQKDIDDVTSGRKKTLGTSNTPSVTRSGRRRIEFIDRSRSTDQGNTRRGPKSRFEEVDYNDDQNEIDEGIGMTMANALGDTPLMSNRRKVQDFLRKREIRKNAEQNRMRRFSGRAVDPNQNLRRGPGARRNDEFN